MWILSSRALIKTADIADIHIRFSRRSIFLLEIPGYDVEASVYTNALQTETKLVLIARFRKKEDALALQTALVDAIARFRKKEDAQALRTVIVDADGLNDKVLLFDVVEYSRDHDLNSGIESDFRW